LGLLVLGAFFFLYLLTSSPVAPLVGDGAVMMTDAVRIVNTGFSRPESLSKFGLGQALLDVPVAAVAARLPSTPSPLRRLLMTVGVSVLPALIGAGVCVLFFLCCLELGYRRIPSALATALLGLTSMQWVYSQSLFAEPTVGLLWVGAFYCLLRFRRAAASVGWVVLAGFLCSYSVLVKPDAVLGPIVFGVAVVAFAPCGGAGRGGLFRWRWLGPFLAPAVPLALLFLWYNHIRYGGWLSMGYGEGRDLTFGFNTPLLTGLYGLLLSSGKGVFWYNPTLVLGMIGLPAFMRRHRGPAWVAIALMLGGLLLHARWWAWHGDWSWGPRFLMPVLPFAFLPAAGMLQRLYDWTGSPVRKRLSYILVAALFFLGMWVQVVGLAVPYHSHLLAVTTQTQVFRGRLYNAETWPIRDDMLQIRFIPEFSPIAGHWWMLRCIINRGTEEGERLRQSPPWIGLNPAWAVKDIKGLLSYNIWWLLCRQQWDQLTGKRWIVPVLALMMAGAAACCLLMLVRRLGSDTDADNTANQRDAEKQYLPESSPADA
jgi:hypothetical protein